MKRCPACNRVETDDELTYCRTDGTPLVRESGAVSESTGTLKFGSAPASNEIDTSILPQVTDASTNRPTAPTTLLPATQSQGTTRALGKSKLPKIVIALGAAIALVLVAVVVIAVASYLYSSRRHAASIQSIAVMPFVNESGNSDNEYLSDGMTETLIGSLSQLPNLSVKARSSVFRYKGKATDAGTIGKELSVQAILNGRVTQRGDQLILSLELMDAQSETVIWSERYYRKQADLIALQTEIARDVSQKLKTKLSGVDEQRLAKNYTENTEAYRLYLRGRFHWNKRAEKDMRKALEYFQQAVAIDPSYALAFTGLADAYSILPEYSNSPPREMRAMAHGFALKALALDNNLAEAHAALGAILETYNYDFAGAERKYKKAIELNPNYATAHQWYGELLSFLGRHEESFSELRRALELDPYSLIINRVYGEALLRARKYDESVAQLKKTIELDVNFAPAYRSLFSTYQAKGNQADSVEALARYFELLGNYQDAVLARESFARGGWQKFQRAMTGEHRPINLPSYIVALFFAELGDKDRAFAELDRAYNNRESYLRLIKTDPRFDPLRDDSRFEELLKKVGFPQ